MLIPITEKMWMTVLKANTCIRISCFEHWEYFVKPSMASKSVQGAECSEPKSTVNLRLSALAYQWPLLKTGQHTLLGLLINRKIETTMVMQRNRDTKQRLACPKTQFLWHAIQSPSLKTANLQEMLQGQPLNGKGISIKFPAFASTESVDNRHSCGKSSSGFTTVMASYSKRRIHRDIHGSPSLQPPWAQLEESLVWKCHVSRGDGQLQWAVRAVVQHLIPFFPTPKNWNSTTELSHANKTLLQICDWFLVIVTSWNYKNPSEYRVPVSD